MLQKILGVVTRPPVPFVLGVVLAVVLVWFGGHLLQGGYGWPSTAMIASLCAAIVLVAVAFVVLRSVQQKRKARAIENEIRNQGKAQAAALPPSSQGEITALQERFDEALESLKTSKLGRGALYAMPWFVMIGPPGSGKTTAITESGLNFPFMKGPNQKRGIRGLGGTRNCDWWFTDQSILLDTAGRYTTEAEDHDEWLTFLGMLKKARKLKPINGAMVAISITDILEGSEEAIERHATTIRQRVDELVKQLEVVFPVYLVFTKCDLLDGFAEFFSALSKEERAQVWGTTFDAKATGGLEMHTRFAAEFELLCQRIGSERMRLLVPDRPTAQQQKIFSLSLQLRAAKRKLTEFVRLLTQPNPYSDASELRGVYLTSGTQEGAPIDLVLQKLSSAFGLQPQADANPLDAVEPKSYFIRDLVTKVVYADRELAHSSAGVQRRREIVRKVVVFGSLAAALLLAVQSVLTWSGTRGLLAGFEGAQQARVAIDPLRETTPDDAAQQALGALRDRYLELQDAYSAASLLGPSRAVVLAAMSSYAKGVRDTFLKPMARHLEQRLRDYVQQTDSGDDFATNSQLVLAYGAMDRDFTPAASLKDAIQQQNLWRWNPADIGKPATTVATSEASRHFEAYLRARAFDLDAWVVGNDKNLLGKARDKVNSGSQLQAVVTEILRKDPTARGATEGDLTKTVMTEVEKQSGTPTQIPKEQVEAFISAKRKLVVIEAMAHIGLARTNTLPDVIESLTDLDRPEAKPLQTFRENLEVLRLAGAAPRPGLGQDTVADAYAAALKEISGLRASIDELVRAHTDRGYLLPDVIAGKSDWTAAFGKKWREAQQNVDRQLKVIEQSLQPDKVDKPTDRVIEPIRASLNGMFDSIAEALAREARGEMQRHWQQAVGTEIATYAERFPCRADAGEDIAPAAFADLFRPGGALDRELGLLDSLRGLKELRNKLEPSDLFEAFLERVRAIQAACFDAAAPQNARLQFHVAKMNISEPVQNLILTIAQGDSVSKQSGSADKIRNQLRTWPIGKVGAQLLLETSVELPNNQLMKLSVPADGASPSPWGLLQVLAQGATERVGNDAKITFEVDYARNDGSKNKAKCWLQLEPEGTQNPFTPSFFHLEPPAHVFQADAR